MAEIRTGTADALALLVRTSSLLCAVPLHAVLETMRPLPIAPLTGVPPFVSGASLIRGAATPVLDLESLVLGRAAPSVRRFVTIRTGERVAALAVEAVIGLRSLGDAPSGSLTPLLKQVGDSVIESIGTLDAHLLAVLRTTHLVPDDVWQKLQRTNS